MIPRHCLRLTLQLLLLGWFSLPLALEANEFREGLQAYLDGDYETAFATWYTLAEQGHAGAQHSLGTLYTSGRGVPQDDRQAAKWYRSAAKQGHAAAQFSLGNAYRSGSGVRRDDRLAAKWWMKAAQQDFVPAQYSLGTLYYSGNSSAQNKKTGLEWYRRAARNGSARAQQIVDKHEPERARPIQVAMSRKKRPQLNHLPPKPVQDEQVVARREAWLLRQEPGAYTIQLTAGRSEQNIRSYIDRHGLSNDAAYYGLQKRGRNWYCLLYGTYADYGQAKHAIDALPTNLRENRPWIRTMASVQKAITEFSPRAP